MCTESVEVEDNCVYWERNSTQHECQYPCSFDYCKKKIAPGFNECIKWLCKSMPKPDPENDKSWQIWLGVISALIVLSLLGLLCYRRGCKYLSIKEPD